MITLPEVKGMQCTLVAYWHTPFLPDYCQVETIWSFPVELQPCAIAYLKPKRLYDES